MARQVKCSPVAFGPFGTLRHIFHTLELFVLPTITTSNNNQDIDRKRPD